MLFCQMSTHLPLDFHGGECVAETRPRGVQRCGEASAGGLEAQLVGSRAASEVAGCESTWLSGCSLRFTDSRWVGGAWLFPQQRCSGWRVDEEFIREHQNLRNLKSRISSTKASFNSLFSNFAFQNLALRTRIRLRTLPGVTWGPFAKGVQTPAMKKTLWMRKWPMDMLPRPE